MNAAIFTCGLSFDKPKPVENFKFDIDTDKLETVKKRLKELQKGYCEGETVKIRVKEQFFPKIQKTVKIVEAYSDSDYSHVAFLGKIIKTLPIPE